MRIKFTAAADANDGYGNITNELISSLLKLGHEVSLNPIKIWYDKGTLKEEVKAVIDKPITPDFELAIMYPTYNFGQLHKKSAIMTMYEANRCPREWTKRLNGLGIPIIAPSNFVKKMFEDSGVIHPIHHLNLGIDNYFYAPIKRTYPEDRPFRFLTVGKLEPRKNIEEMVRCFQTAFPTENVEYIIKTRERFLPKSVLSAAQEDHRIKIISKTLPEKDLRKLYYFCDCFLYCSRGEGFAFPPRNAVASGMPTLVTDWSALAEIPGAFKVEVDSMSPMPSCGFSYGEEHKLLMADIMTSDLIWKMQKLVDSKEYYNEVAENTYKVNQDTWEDCAKKLVNLIESMI